MDKLTARPKSIPEHPCHDTSFTGHPNPISRLSFGHSISDVHNVKAVHLDAKQCYADSRTVIRQPSAMLQEDSRWCGSHNLQMHRSAFAVYTNLDTNLDTRSGARTHACRARLRAHLRRGLAVRVGQGHHPLVHLDPRQDPLRLEHVHEGLPVAALLVQRLLEQDLGARDTRMS